MKDPISSITGEVIMKKHYKNAKIKIIVHGDTHYCVINVQCNNTDILYEISDVYNGDIEYKGSVPESVVITSTKDQLQNRLINIKDIIDENCDEIDTFVFNCLNNVFKD